MIPAQDLAALLRILEEQLFDPATRHNPEAVAEHLADNFREFGSSGRVFTKQQIIADLAAESTREISLTAFHCELIAPETALVTYCATSIANGKTTVSLRSSLWQFSSDRWQMIFHQGTRIPSAEPGS